MRRLSLPLCAVLALLAGWVADTGPAPRQAPAPGVGAPEEGAAAAPEVPAPPDAASPAAPEDAETPVLEGTVEDPEGRGVEGVMLRAFFEKHGSSGYPHYLGLETALTDGSGRFSLEVSRRADWATIWIDAPGWVRPATRTAGPSVSDVVGRKVGWASQKIVLERGAPVEGIAESPAGVPLPDVLIEANWGDGGRSLCRTDERGRFSIVVPAEAVLVALAHRGALVSKEEGPGFLPWAPVPPRRFDEILSRDAEAWVGPVAPGSSGVRMVLRDVVPLRMRVQGPDGPLSGRAIVRVTDLAWRALGSFTCEPYVDEGDLLVIQGLVPGRYAVEILPRQQEWLPAAAIATLPGEPVDVRCAQALRIDGLLEGDDPKGFEVTWTGPCNEKIANAVQSGRTLEVDGPAFTLMGIGDGFGDLYARRAGDPRFALVTGVRVGKGVVRLTLSAGQTIRGRVEIPAGPKSSWLCVRALRGLLEQRAPVGDDGTFAITGLPPGTFRVELVTGTWTDQRSRRGGRVIGEWAVRWLHDARDDVPAGEKDVRLRVRLPAADAERGGS